MTNIFFDEKKQVLIWEFNDLITIYDILDSIEKINEYSYKNEIKIYCSATDSLLAIRYEELPYAAEKIQNILNYFTEIKLSIVVNNPKTTAFFYMAFIDIQKDNLTSKVFSTEKAAKEWLF